MTFLALLMVFFNTIFSIYAIYNTLLLKYGWISTLLLQTIGLLACVAVKRLILALLRLYTYFIRYMLCLWLYRALYSLLYTIL